MIIKKRFFKNNIGNKKKGQKRKKPVITEYEE